MSFLCPYDDIWRWLYSPVSGYKIHNKMKENDKQAVILWSSASNVAYEQDDLHLYKIQTQ